MTDPWRLFFFHPLHCPSTELSLGMSCEPQRNTNTIVLFVLRQRNSRIPCGNSRVYDVAVIDRPMDVSCIRAALKRNRVAALLGPRQCGKTTLARQFVPTDSLNYRR